MRLSRLLRLSGERQGDGEDRDQTDRPEPHGRVLWHATGTEAIWCHDLGERVARPVGDWLCPWPDSAEGPDAPSPCWQVTRVTQVTPCTAFFSKYDPT